MTSSKRKGLRWAAVAVALAMFGAACGGDSESSDTTAAAASEATEEEAPAAAGKIEVVISTDLPLQGASADASRDTNRAVQMIIDEYNAGDHLYNVTLKEYDDSTAAKGGWDDAVCAKNGADHVANVGEIAVMGTYNSGCAKIIIPILNEDAESGGMLMISHANTNPGITKTWDPGEPDKYYPTGTRNYGRIIATDEYQGAAGAQFAATDLGVTKCVVLDDAQTYGVGVAEAFENAAPAAGIEVVARGSWDSKQPNYTALFEGYKKLSPDCVYLGGINDNNGEQLIRDKVSVLGPNDGAVKLVTPDGFSGYPSVQALAEAQGMYITFAGLPASELRAAGGAGAAFVDNFKAKFGADPVSAYAIYGAAATQLILAALDASDGTRRGVREAAFSGTVSVGADVSVIGKEFSITTDTGDVTVRDMSIQILKDNAETFLKAWPLDG